MKFVISPSSEYEKVVSAFKAYDEYWDENLARAPKGLKQFIVEPWLYDFRDWRCPHDAGIDSIRFEGSKLRIRCDQSDKHGSIITFVHHGVHRFEFEISSSMEFHCHEFMLVDANKVSHEIETLDGGNILVECEDVELIVERL